MSVVRGGRADDVLLILGDERGRELTRWTIEKFKAESFSTEELVYISEVIDYVAWLSSEVEEGKALEWEL